MIRTHRLSLSIWLAFALTPFLAHGQNLELRNTTTIASFGPDGLVSVHDIQSNSDLRIVQDHWLLSINDVLLGNAESPPVTRQPGAREISYNYEISGYRVKVAYSLEPSWQFVAKRIEVLRAPTATYMIHRVIPWDLTVSNAVTSDYLPSTYAPQFGWTREQSRSHLPGKDFGELLRLGSGEGAMLVVQNPFLEVRRNGQSVSVAYAPEMEWKQEWGGFQTDTAVVRSYRLSGRRMPRGMVKEWHLGPVQTSNDGMDEAEITALTDCVHSFLINAASAPISVEVGWTLNDYQIDVGTEAGKVEYRHIIDTASQLGIQTLLYAPANSKLADRAKSADSWSWEYVLWLNMGENIREGHWNPAEDAIPADISEMLAYAQQKHVGLLAYVYPSVPFAANPVWLVKRAAPENDQFMYSTLASREFQDYLIRNLIAFRKRTRIAGYSFDYTWLNLPGSSSYAQWYGWRRVIETLRRADPSIVIDGRQTYQLFGPWTWLAGSYPHPTGNDEQPESFKPYPDLHFDRVSADRTRFVNYWYRNYQFAPEEIIPGYATHQTERFRDIPRTGDPKGKYGPDRDVEMMYSAYRLRDWDLVGYRYSFISSIATGGWNNVVDMIPARDKAESENFSSEDKAWIRGWLDWTTKNIEYLLHTRTILGQPALGRVDGTAAVIGDRGYIFLFNPNYKRLIAAISLDQTIGLTKGDNFLIKEVYPENQRLIGRPGSGVWRRGDSVQLDLDGTSATVLELVPQGEVFQPILLNAAALNASISPSVQLKSASLVVEHAAGEPGTSQHLGVLLPSGSKVSTVTVNGHAVRFTQSGSYVEAEVKFNGSRFAQAQEISVSPGADGLLTGTFVVPHRVLDQLALRKLKWPIPWTQEDYESTWLVPERLLLFLQTADGNDSMAVTGTLDGQPLKIRPAYSSSRVHADSFVGFYADLSRIAPDIPHTIELSAPQMAPDQLLGMFFDNVDPQFTEALEP